MADGIATRPLARVLVVDDSAFMRTALARMIASESAFAVVGTACDGSDALEKIALLDPDVVTLDVEMPHLDGLATLRQIMQRFPRPVIMISAATEENAEITLNALSAGAFDYIPKQLAPTSLDIDHVRADLIAKIRAAASARRSGRGESLSKKPVQSFGMESRRSASGVPAVVAIGTSTGGPKALEHILRCLPRDFGLPILIVQHMPPGFGAAFARRLNAMCAITVREAAQLEVAQPGIAYLAPAGLHMRLTRRLSDLRAVISLDAEPTDALHIPSIDVLMKSVAETYKDRSLGIILTGMGSDGAEGMKAIYRAGGLTIGQDEASCTVYGMPRVCAESGVLCQTVALLEIPAQIMQAVSPVHA